MDFRGYFFFILLVQVDCGPTKSTRCPFLYVASLDACFFFFVSSSIVFEWFCCLFTFARGKQIPKKIDFSLLNGADIEWRIFPLKKCLQHSCFESLALCRMQRNKMVHVRIVAFSFYDFDLD